MNAFENESFEGVEELTDPAEDLRQKTVQALYEEVPAYDAETGEVTDNPLSAEEAKGLALLSLDSLRSHQKANKRVKRTEQQMIQSFNGNSMRESVYVLERISKLEDKMSELLNSVGTKAQAMIVSERPELSRFVK
jgi:hypothetical protein